MSRFINDVTCDKIINTKGDNKKYRDNWDKIFGKSKEEMKEHVQQITGDVPHTVVEDDDILERIQQVSDEMDDMNAPYLIEVSEEDYQLIWDRINNPEEPTEKLKEVFRRYNEQKKP